jgi:hypothetical protein
MFMGLEGQGCSMNLGSGGGDKEVRTDSRYFHELGLTNLLVRMREQI